MHTIYTKSNCRYCEIAKQWLKTNEVLFQEQSLDDLTIRELFKQAYPMHRSVPVVMDENGVEVVSWKHDNAKGAI